MPLTEHNMLRERREVQVRHLDWARRWEGVVRMVVVDGSSRWGCVSLVENDLIGETLVRVRI